MAFDIKIESRFTIIVLDEHAIDTFERALRDVRDGHQVIIADGQGPLTKIRVAKNGELAAKGEA